MVFETAGFDLPTFSATSPSESPNSSSSIANARAASTGERSSRPFPSPFRLGTLDKLHRHLPVRVGAARAAVVRDRRQTVARSFCEPHRARHRGLEHELAEVASHLALHLGRKTRTAVHHRH